MLGPNFSEVGERLPVVIQDYLTNEVLMVGYVNQEAWALTLSTGMMYYFSRKKKRIWFKGEQSGNYQFVKQVFLNCDNTCLLVKVEQRGGACDQGLKSCFDKVLDGDHFESTGATVFDPERAYGKNFTATINLGIPTGSLENMTFRLLKLAGYEVHRGSGCSYQPVVVNASDVILTMARAEELPILVEQGILDIALTGMDLVQETGASIRDVSDLGYNKLGIGEITLALAVPNDMAVSSLRDLEEMRIATAYKNLTRRFFEDRGVKVQIIPSVGATEDKVPLIADIVVDLVETGATLEAHQLRPVVALCKTTVHLIASNSSWGYTWKRRNIEEIAAKLALAADNLPRNPKQNLLILELIQNDGSGLAPF